MKSGRHNQERQSKLQTYNHEANATRFSLAYIIRLVSLDVVVAIFRLRVVVQMSMYNYARDSGLKTFNPEELE